MELREVRGNGEWKVEIVEGNRSVSQLWIIDRSMRIGSCPVKTGGIGGVGTDREYRMQGLAKRVLEGAVELMQREGYDASFLYGIQDFYHRFGYVTCMPERRLYVDTRAAERAEKRGKMRRVKKTDWPQIVRIYNRDNDRRTASVVRAPRTWDRFPMGSQFGVKAEVWVAVDDRDRIKGYIAVDDVEHRVRAAELGGEGEDLFHSLLQFLASRAVKLRRQELSLSIPVDHPFALFCRNFGCRESTHFGRNGGPMGRIINLNSLLEKILPELGERWGYGDREVGVSFATDLGNYSLNWKGGKLPLAGGGEGCRVRLRQEALMLLLMGYRTPSDLLAEGEIKVGRRVLPLLERLFPLQQAHMWWPDRF